MEKFGANPTNICEISIANKMVLNPHKVATSH